jgi:hypothetical protein
VRAVEVLRDAHGRMADATPEVVAGLDADALSFRPDGAANSIGWLVWHLVRVQDSHVAELVDDQQLWETGPWAAALGLAADPADTGYGHGADQAAAVRPAGPDPLVDYHRAVWARTERYLATLTDDELDRVVDESWDPPVTLGVRLVSVVSDGLQHLGQAAYLRGLLGR